MTADTYRVVFSNADGSGQPIPTAAMTKADALAAFDFQLRIPRFSVWGGDWRMRVVREEDWEAIRAMAERAGAR